MVIINLLNNASEHTKNGNIMISANQLSCDSEISIVEFCIKDTWTRISKKQLIKIYYSFNNNLDLVK